MKLPKYSFVVIAALMCLSALAQDREDARVPTSEPTVVTVRGKYEQPQRSGNKIARALRTSAAKAWNGVIDFSGWLMNAGNDIPSDRERRKKAQAQQR